MKLSIYSLKNILFQGSATSLNCQTVMGEITVLDNHEALISVLSAGVVKIIDENKREQNFPIKSGFLEVLPAQAGKPGNEVRCIVEQ